ncbi:hypothetical protein V6N13_008863 [Hibiscus sabdariffa]
METSSQSHAATPLVYYFFGIEISRLAAWLSATTTLRVLPTSLALGVTAVGSPFMTVLKQLMQKIGILMPARDEQLLLGTSMSVWLRTILVKAKNHVSRSYWPNKYEYLAGQLPVSFARPEAQRNLSSYFIIAMQQDRLFEILEPGLANEGNNEQFKAVADLTMRCLRLKEVVSELAGSRGIDKHPWDRVNRTIGLTRRSESL